MVTTATTCPTTKYAYDDEQTWNDLYIWLLSMIEKWVFYANVSCWRGQLKEVAEDIAQEAILRTLKYTQRASLGEVQPVVSLRSLSKVIAQNYFRDRRRKDLYLVLSSQNDDSDHLLSDEVVDPAQIALDDLFFRSVIVLAARIVAKFPQQQRMALLTDLANISDFNAPPTLLEQVLSAEGICLRDYNHPLPLDPSMRGRYAAHLCIAYKRLKKKVCL